MSITIYQLEDKTKILNFLNQDRLYAAYAIGDLEPGLFNQTEWIGAEKSGKLVAITLYFIGIQPAALFLMGTNEGLDRIFVSGYHPDNVTFLCRPEHYPTTSQFYAWGKRLSMWRMGTDSDRFLRVESHALRLDTTHVEHLVALFGDEGADAFSPFQVEDGVFYGIFKNQQLVSTAGTHLVSQTYNLAAVGNIYTHPEHRGKGYGTQATSAVVAELLNQGIRDVVLNVEQDNIPANHVYERLGFERYCPFFEGHAVAL